MIDPVAVSGSVDLGLGLDEGFLLTGPTNTARVAELFPAIPGDRTRALVELNDADSVEVEHLTLRDAERGLYAHNGSADVVGARPRRRSATRSTASASRRTRRRPTSPPSSRTTTARTASTSTARSAA